MEEGGSSHTHWNPGITQPPAQTQWQTPNPGGSCLMTGGGGGGGQEAMFGYHHSLQRFGQQSIHPYTTMGGGGGGGHESIGISIPSLESAEGEEDDGGGGMRETTGLPSHCTEECSEEEEDSEMDEEEDDDEEINETGQYGHQAMVHSHVAGMDNNGLASCQQSHQMRTEAALMDSSMERGENGLINHVQELEDDIPPITEEHSSLSNQIPSMPLIGTSLMLQNGGPMHMGINMGTQLHSDPTSSRRSVHGQMFMEVPPNRILLQLKEWTDEGFGNYNSCREEAQKSRYLCPLSHLGCCHDGIQNKDGHVHSHAIRGILRLAAPGCMSFELYPGDFNACNENQQQFDPKLQSVPVPMTVDKEVEVGHMTAYYTSNATTTTTVIQDMGLSGSTDKPEASTIQEHQSSGDWWEGYGTGEPEDARTSSDPMQQRQLQSFDQCAISLKLTAQRYHDATEAAQDVELNDTEDIASNAEEEGSVAGVVPAENQDQTIPYTRYSPSDSYLQKPAAQEDVTKPPEESTNVDASAVTESSDVLDVGSGFSGKVDSCKKAIQLVKKKGKKTSFKNPCPSCAEGFQLKLQLKRHLSEKHSSGNPFQCKKCKTQCTDGERLRKHRCTMNVEFVKQSIKAKEAKNLLKIKQNQNRTKSNLTVAQASSTETTAAEVTLPNASKVRKFSRNAQGKESRSYNDENSTTNSSLPSSVSTEDISRLDAMQEKSECENSRLGTTINNTDSSLSKAHRLSFQVQPILIKVNQASPIVKDFICEFCGKVYSSPERLEKHLRSHEEGKTEEFICEVCGRGFSTVKRLQQHSSSNHHRTEKDKECGICGKTFSRKDKLQRHMFSHSEKQFSCEVCDKRFSRKDKLADHMKSHLADEIHKCPKCEKQFYRRDIFKQHIKTHERKEKHQCPQCLRFVTGADRFKSHVERHNKAKEQGQQLNCKYCDSRSFITAQSLKAHVRKFHPSESRGLKKEKNAGKEGGGEGSSNSSAAEDSSSNSSSSDNLSSTSMEYKNQSSGIKEQELAVLSHHPKAFMVLRKEQPKNKRNVDAKRKCGAGEGEDGRQDKKVNKKQAIRRSSPTEGTYITDSNNSGATIPSSHEPPSSSLVQLPSCSSLTESASVSFPLSSDNGSGYQGTAVYYPIPCGSVTYRFVPFHDGNRPPPPLVPILNVNPSQVIPVENFMGGGPSNNTPYAVNNTTYQVSPTTCFQSE